MCVQTMMQSLKVQASYCKTHKIGNIMFKNASPHNLDIAPKGRSS